jgi:hypothetical protein
MGYNYIMEEELRQILFELGTSIKIHKIDSNNSVLEIDYEQYVQKIMQLVESSACEPQ